MRTFISRKLGLLCVVLLAVASLAGPAGAAQVSSVSGPAGRALAPQVFTLSGRVTDAASGQGVQAHLVFVTSPVLVPDVDTDANGNYSVPLDTPGTYTIEFSSGHCLIPVQRTLTINGDTTLNVGLNRKLDIGGGAVGYSCDDAVAFNWIAGTNEQRLEVGTQISVTLPFAFTYYGQPIAANTVSVTPMGYLTAGRRDGIQETNQAIPDTTAPNNVIAPYWDQFDTTNEGSLFTTVVGSAPNRQFVIEWRNMRLAVADFSDPLLNFEVIFYEGTNELRFQYQEVGAVTSGHGLGATIGLESPAGTAALKYLQDVATLNNGTAVRYYQPPLGTVGGTVRDLYTNAPLRAHVCAAPDLCTDTDVTTGQYNLSLIAAPYNMTASASRHVSQTHPVTIVAGQNQTIDFQLDSAHVLYNPAPVNVTIRTNTITNRPLLLNNVGAGPLNYRLREALGPQPVGCGAFLSPTTPAGSYTVVRRWTETHAAGNARQKGLSDESVLYKYQADAPAPQPTNILVYADDPYHGATFDTTYPALALQALGWTYTGIFNSLAQFETQLNAPPSGGWNLVIFINDRNVPGPTLLERLRTYMENENGRLVFQTFDYDTAAQTTLFNTLGIVQPTNGNVDSPVPVYEWEPTEFIFRCPINIPVTDTLQMQTPPSPGFNDYGDYLTANDFGLEWGGFTIDPIGGRATIVGRDDGRAVSAGFLISTVTGDGNGNSKAEGIDLLTNMIKYVGNPPIPWGDITWLSESPTNGVVTPTTGFTDTLTFNTNGLAPNTTYTGYLFGLTNDPNSVRQQIQVNLTVCEDPNCPPIGPDLTAQVTNVRCYGGNCHRPQAGLNDVMVRVTDYGSAPVTWVNGYLYVDVYMDLGHPPGPSDQSVGFALVPGTGLQPGQWVDVPVTVNIPGPQGNHEFYAWVNRDCVAQVYEDTCSNNISLASYYCTHPDDTWTFTDAQWAYTFYTYTEYLSCQGAISGYGCGGVGEPCDGQNRPWFRGGNGATRGQFSKILSQAIRWTDAVPPTQQTFEDVPFGSTFWVFIERAASRGVISGYGCGGVGEPCVPPNNRPYFRPSAAVTRGQVTKLVVNAKGWGGLNNPDPTFSDVPTSNPFYVFIERAYAKGVLSGYGCGSPGEPCNPPGNKPYFRAGVAVTRGQLSKMTTLAVTQP